MNCIRTLILLTASALVAPIASAQGTYPTKPIHFVVPFSAGGESDIVAREIANKLTALRGYTVIVDNFPGAGGSLGTEKALKETADGHTLLVISGAYAVNAVLNKRADAMTRIQPVIQFGSQPSVLVANRKYGTLNALLEKARNSPESINYGTAGIGSLGHLSNENFAMVAGVKLNHIPYKGNSAAIADLAGGQLDMMFAGVTGAMTLAKGGQVRILAVSTSKRIPVLPEVPTLVESGVSLESGLWHGLVASKDVPPAIVEKLNADLNAVLRDPEIVVKFNKSLITPIGGTSAQFKEVMQLEMERAQRIIKTANIKLE